MTNLLIVDKGHQKWYNIFITHLGGVQMDREEELKMLNQICIKCMKNNSTQYIPFDYSKCTFCPTGHRIHALDKDDVDIFNDFRYGTGG